MIGSPHQLAQYHVVVGAELCDDIVFVLHPGMEDVTAEDQTERWDFVS